ncbi:MAG TPA: efflux RND transporter periplasmic adaptor subunit [Steroidobacteraceae bacterium]|nr:efflux RND transporter periplasmic adaptor subunit [Steroidobacteraceae bacterium]
MHWKFRAVYLLPLFAAAAVGGVLWWRNRPLDLDIVHAHRGPAVLAVYATGVVEPIIDVPIAPRVAGKLVELLADEGDRVARDQVLARLEDTDLTRGIEQLEAQEQFAKQDLDRQDSILARGLGAQADRDRAFAAWRAAHAATDRARAEQAFTLLRAPSAGVVMRRDGEVGQYIAVNQVVFHIADPAKLRISADVDEEDIPQVAVGQRVLIRADAFPQQGYEGRVLEVTPRGDTSTRSYRVRVSIPPGAPLRVGMTTDTNIVIDQHADALLLPASAVSDAGVWVVRAGRASHVAVKAGIAGEREVEILGGVTEADAVVAAPPAELRDGRRVRVRTAAVQAVGQVK